MEPAMIHLLGTSHAMHHRAGSVLFNGIEYYRAWRLRLEERATPAPPDLKELRTHDYSDASPPPVLNTCGACARFEMP
jgi:hypothetical protein